MFVLCVHVCLQLEIFFFSPIFWLNVLMSPSTTIIEASLSYFLFLLYCRFNFLHVPKDMKSKNVEALRTLIALCDSDTDALQESWVAVLSCISRLDYLTSNPTAAATVMQGSNQISRDAILQSLRELAGKPAEQVFVNSVKLSSESVVEFFTSLCNVSVDELRQYPARVYSLQKLVEISYYNMARIRMVAYYSFFLFCSCSLHLRRLLCVRFYVVGHAFH
jgi:hypothetical protein